MQTSQQNHTMVARLRCENGEWKTRDHFSQRQLEKYEQQARAGRATAAKTGIRCMEHASKHGLELKCNGPCNRYRELRYFSKSTRRNGKNWCVDCTDWQLKTENGEALPPPGSQLSVDEVAPRLPHPAHLRDDIIFEQEAPNFNDVESSFATEDDGRTSDMMSTLSISDNQPASLESVTGDEEEDEEDFPAYQRQRTTAHTNRLESFIPTHLRHRPTRAPHWLIPEFPGSSIAPSSLTTSVDATSIAGSVSTAPARGNGNRGQPVSFNAWGPNGEYARMTKTPTVASASTRATTVTRGEPEKGRKAWAKVPTRKQPPQLPDYLKYDIPVAEGDDSDGLDLDSDDGITFN